MKSIIENQFTTSSSYLSDSTFGPPFNDENVINDLSSDSDTYFKQQSQHVHDSIVEEEMNKLCGQIFVTKNFLLTFKCYLCSKNLTNISEFSNHLQKSHSNLICNKRNDSNLSIIEPYNIEKMSEKIKDEIENNLNFETILIENIKKDSDAIFSTDQEYTEILTNCDIKSENTFSATLETDNHISIKKEYTNEIDKNNEDNLYEKSKKINGTLLEETKKDVLEHSLCNSTHYNQKIPKDSNQQSTNSFQCEICSSVFSKPESLNRHLKRHLNHGRFKCEFCSKGFSTSSDKNRHEKNIHENENCNIKEISLSTIHAKSDTEKTPDDSNQQSKNTFQCEICSSVYSKQESLNRHLKRHLNRGRFNCEFCSKGFSENSEKNRHVKRVHKNENCNIKEISLCTIDAKSDNEKTPDDSNQQSTNTFQCEICSSVFSKLKSLNRHLKRHLNHGRFKCEFCSKGFSTSSDKNRHEKNIHKNEKYGCDICKKLLSSKLTLANHIKLHTGTVIRPHQCHLCEKFFSDLGNLKCHIRRHLGVKKHECQYCEMAFVSSTEKKSHERKHRDEKPFLCTKCGKSFITSSHLTVHLRMHSGTKPYKCEKCEKSFYQIRCLKEHLLVHSGLKPYQCKICNASFSRKRYMKLHERRHSDKAQYACKICDKKFKQRANMYSHMKSHNTNCIARDGN